MTERHQVADNNPGNMSSPASQSQNSITHMINIVYRVSLQSLLDFLFATKQTKENHLTFFVPSENILSSFLRRMFQYLNPNTLIYIQEVFKMPDWRPIAFWKTNMAVYTANTNTNMAAYTAYSI